MASHHEQPLPLEWQLDGHGEDAGTMQGPFMRGGQRSGREAAPAARPPGAPALVVLSRIGQSVDRSICPARGQTMGQTTVRDILSVCDRRTMGAPVRHALFYERRVAMAQFAWRFPADNLRLRVSAARKETAHRSRESLRRALRRPAACDRARARRLAHRVCGQR